MADETYGAKQHQGACADCGLRYGDKYGFPDLLVPDSVWKKISPLGHEGGLLCPSCMCRRLHEAGITCPSGQFTSGPLVPSKSDQEMARVHLREAALKRWEWEVDRLEKLLKANGVSDPRSEERNQLLTSDKSEKPAKAIREQ